MMKKFSRGGGPGEQGCVLGREAVAALPGLGRGRAEEWKLCQPCPAAAPSVR